MAYFVQFALWLVRVLAEYHERKGENMSAKSNLEAAATRLEAAVAATIAGHTDAVSAADANAVADRVTSAAGALEALNASN